MREFRDGRPRAASTQAGIRKTPLKKPRPKVIGDDMLIFARALKDNGTPVPEIAENLVIRTGKNAGKHPWVASLYRALSEAEETAVILRPARAPVPGLGGSHYRNQGHGDSQRITRPIITIRRAKRCRRADREWRP